MEEVCRILGKFDRETFWEDGNGKEKKLELSALHSEYEDAYGKFIGLAFGETSFQA